MSKCKYQAKIDEYLLGRLSGEEKEAFEKHYYECRECFTEMTMRNEIIGVVRQGGAFNAEAVPAGATRRGWLSGLTPARWAVAGASAALVLLVVWLALPKSGPTAPQFVLNNSQVLRGSSIQASFPATELGRAPEYLEWKAPAGEGLEYRVTISNGKLLWSASTTQTRIDVPAAVRAMMHADTAYSWQVKAFDKGGTLVSASSPIAFKISR